MRCILILFPFLAFSQQVKKPDTVFCDCIKARTVALKATTKIGPTIAPPSGGEQNEISERLQKTKFAFEKEHFTAWYKLNIATNGSLVFDIIPSKAEDDYDFMLFKASAKGFCDSMQKYNVKPLRACVSRAKEEIKGLTGLSYKGKKELIKEGLGDAFAKPVDVKSGEVYYLVLDNVYKEGQGHSINFYFEEIVTIKGKTQDENELPIKAEITITGPAGDTLKKITADNKGNYDFEVVLRQNLKYSINFYNDSNFIASKEITTKTNKDTLKNISTVLPTLKKGNKYIVQNINFYPGQATVLPSAYPSLKNLVRLMRKNESLKILIVGHVNGCTESKYFVEKLSRSRAITIKKFLETNRIDNGRINTDGKGCSQMLYPFDLKNEIPEWQQVLNRRVEIFILEK